MGAATRGVDEAVGEVTGRNMARDQAWKAQKKIDEEAINRQREMDLARQQQFKDDQAASFQAQAGRNTAGSRSNRSLKWQPLGSPDDQDFLGL